MPVAAKGESSSYTLVIAPPGTDRFFLHCPGTNDTFGSADISDLFLRDTRLFHLGYPPLLRRMYADGGKELASIFQRAREAGATTSLDMSLPDISRPSGQADWEAILTLTLPYVDVFLPSVEELLLMLDRARYMELVSTVGQGGMLTALSGSEIVALADRAMELGAHIVVLKAGDRGLMVRTCGDLADIGRATPQDAANWQNRELWAPSFKAIVVSTAGSGDAAIAGFLAAMLHGQSIEQAANTAAAVGAFNVEALDTLSGIRSWDETQRRIRAGWETQTVPQPAEGWVWRPATRLWHGPRDNKEQ